MISKENKMRLLSLAFIVAIGGISLATFATSETLNPMDEYAISFFVFE
jgi:hypothetical protein